MQSAPCGKTVFMVRTLMSIRIPKVSGERQEVSSTGQETTPTGQETASPASSEDTNEPGYVPETTVQVIKDESWRVYRNHILSTHSKCTGGDRHFQNSSRLARPIFLRTSFHEGRNRSRPAWAKCNIG